MELFPAFQTGGKCDTIVWLQVYKGEIITQNTINAFCHLTTQSVTPPHRCFQLFGSICTLRLTGISLTLLLVLLHLLDQESFYGAFKYMEFGDLRKL